MHQSNLQGKELHIGECNSSLAGHLHAPQKKGDLVIELSLIGHRKNNRLSDQSPTLRSIIFQVCNFPDVKPKFCIASKSTWARRAGSHWKKREKRIHRRTQDAVGTKEENVKELCVLFMRNASRCHRRCSGHARTAPGSAAP